MRRKAKRRLTTGGDRGRRGGTAKKRKSGRSGCKIVERGKIESAKSGEFNSP